VVLFACIFLLPEAYSIDVSLSAENGGDSVSVDSSYEVDTEVSVSEESEASFDEVGIENSRSLSGTGKAKAAQTYSGSGGYSGSSSFTSSGSGSLTGSANLNPESMNAMQDISASGESSADMTLTHGGTASVGCNLYSGSINALQSISTGSAHGSQNVYGSGSLSASAYGSDNSLSAMQEAYEIDGALSTSQNVATSGSIFANQITTLNGGTGGVSGYALGQNNYISVTGEGQIQDSFEADLSSFSANRGSIQGSASIGGIECISDESLSEISNMNNAMHGTTFQYVDGNSFQSFISNYKKDDGKSSISEDKLWGLLGIQWKGTNPNIEIVVDSDSLPTNLKEEKDRVRRDIDYATNTWSQATNRQLFKPVEILEGLKPPLGGLKDNPSLDKDGKPISDDFNYNRDYKNTIGWVTPPKEAANQYLACTSWWAGEGKDPRDEKIGIGANGIINRDARDQDLYGVWEADIAFNSFYDWRTQSEGANKDFDVGTIAFHELGHVLGLRDLYLVSDQLELHHDPNTYTRYVYPDQFKSEVQSQIMYGRAGYESSTMKLGAGDIAGIQRLYPDLPANWDVMPKERIQDHIDKANTGDTITIAPGEYPENLKIPIALTLKGDGSGEDGTIVDGGNSGSVISIIGSPDFNINVLLSNMLIRNGLSTTGGGIYNFGSTLTVDSCRISGNDATQFGGGGGGIYNSGALTIKDSDISENTAKYAGAGIYNDHGTFKMESGKISDNIASYYGGGIYNVEGSSTINGGTISKNKALEGGGIYNSQNDFTMNGGTISENSAHSDISGLSGSGGGIANNGGSFVLNAGTISDNTADYAGGGVWNSGSAFTMNDGTITKNRANKGGGIATYWGTFEMNGGTISENIAENNVEDGIGGGIYNSKGALTQNGGTISGNDAQKGAGIYNYGTAIITDGEISQNIAINDGGGIYNDGTLTFKLSDGTVIPQNDPRVANIVFDNHLGSLNGALNNIAPEIIKKWMVNPGEFIQHYIDLANPGDTITIAPGIFNENLVIDRSLTLIGAASSESGTVVDGNGLGSVIRIAPDLNVFLSNMLIRNGMGTLDQSGSYVLGGGIFNEGSLTVDHCTITDNGYTRGNWASGPMTHGGGIYSSGDLTGISSTISGNEANAGAGIYLDNKGISPSGLKAEITDSKISANIAANGGGGIYNNGAHLILTGSEITGNGAHYYGTGGGGIANMNIGVVEMVSGTVSGNSAFDGSGVKNYGTFTMKGGSISQNKAYSAPAGIWATSSGGGVDNSGTFNLEGGSISGNYAHSGGGVFNSVNSGTFNLKGGSINNNFYDAPDGSHWIPYNGGGIYNSGTLNIEGGSISGNTAYNDGGGIYNSGTIYPDYSKCSFGTGADANSPNDHN
jgi:hypothetical protein